MALLRIAIPTTTDDPHDPRLLTLAEEAAARQATAWTTPVYDHSLEPAERPEHLQGDYNVHIYLTDAIPRSPRGPTPKRPLHDPA